MKALGQFLLFLLLCAAAVFLPLLLGLTVVPGCNGMAVCFLSFYVTSPAASVGAGVWAGRSPRRRWYGILVPGAVFLLSAWSLLDWGNPQFFWYAGAYLLLSAAAFLLTWLAGRLRCWIRGRNHVKL